MNPLGSIKDEALKTVEVLNTETGEWHTVADLPQPLSISSIALCGYLVYLLGGFNEDKIATNSVHSCSLTSLLSSTGSTSLRGQLGRYPMEQSCWSHSKLNRSTAVNLHGRLLALGGEHSKGEPTTAVHIICTSQPLTPGRSSVTWQLLGVGVYQLSSLTTNWW